MPAAGMGGTPRGRSSICDQRDNSPALPYQKYGSPEAWNKCRQFPRVHPELPTGALTQPFWQTPPPPPQTKFPRPFCPLAIHFWGPCIHIGAHNNNLCSLHAETPSRLEWPNSMFQGHNRFLPSALGAAVAVLLGLFISGTRRKFRAQAVPLPPAPMDVVAPVFDTPKRLAMIATAGEKTDAAVESSRSATCDVTRL